MRFTLDTNILVYAADEDAGDRHETSLDILRRAHGQGGILILQSLGELSRWLLTRARMPASKVGEVIDSLRSTFPVYGATGASLSEAIHLVGAHGFSFWDAMLFATARQAGCVLLISEDGHDGLTVDGLTVANPFAAVPSPLIARALGA